MDADDYDFCTALAFIGNWTDDNIEGRIKAIFGNFPVSRYETLRNSSFIVEENGNLKIHDVVKDVIIASTKEATRNKIIKAIQSEADQKIQDAIEQKTEKIKKLQSETFEQTSIVSFDDYDEKNTYEKIIRQLFDNIAKCQNDEDFNNSVDYLITKIEEYENQAATCYVITAKNLEKLKAFKNTIGFQKLSCFKENISIKEIYRIYQELKNHYHIKDYLFPIRRYAIYGGDNQRDIKLLNDMGYYEQLCDIAHREKLDELYTIRLEHVFNPNRAQHLPILARQLLAYLCKDPSALYIDLICEAANLESLEEHLLNDKASKNIEYYFYENLRAEIRAEANRFYYNLTEKLIHTLTEQPQLLTPEVIHNFATNITELVDEVDSAKLIFDYVYSIRYSIFTTADEALINDFSIIMRTFLGLDQRLLRIAKIEDYKNIMFYAKDCLEIITDRCAELYGKESPLYQQNNSAVYSQYIKLDQPGYITEYIDDVKNKYGIADEYTQLTIAYFMQHFAFLIDNSFTKEYFELVLLFDYFISIAKELAKVPHNKNSEYAYSTLCLSIFVSYAILQNFDPEPNYWGRILELIEIKPPHERFVNIFITDILKSICANISSGEAPTDTAIKAFEKVQTLYPPEPDLLNKCSTNRMVFRKCILSCCLNYFLDDLDPEKIKNHQVIIDLLTKTIPLNDCSPSEQRMQKTYLNKLASELANIMDNSSANEKASNELTFSSLSLVCICYALIHSLLHNKESVELIDTLAKQISNQTFKEKDYIMGEIKFARRNTAIAVKLKYDGEVLTQPSKGEKST